VVDGEVDVRSQASDQKVPEETSKERKAVRWVPRFHRKMEAEMNGKQSYFATQIRLKEFDGGYLRRAAAVSSCEALP